ncbi:MAG: hypothetical protein MJZ81_07255 [Bacteroidales bacterium]|nr:hypothetical protein [Bacteroidales bacterium]
MASSSTTFALADGDLAVENGRFKIAYGKDAYLVRIHTAIHTLLGECILDPGVGIDYFDTIFDITKPNGVRAFESRVKRLVSSFDFVTAISKCVVTMVDGVYRVAKLDLVVETDSGVLEDTFDISQTQVAIVDPSSTLPLQGQRLPISTFDNSFASAKKVAETMGGTDESEAPATGTPSPDFNGMKDQSFSVSDFNGFAQTVQDAGWSVGVGVSKKNLDNVHAGLKSVIEALGGTV